MKMYHFQVTYKDVNGNRRIYDIYNVRSTEELLNKVIALGDVKEVEEIWQDNNVGIFYPKSHSLPDES